MYLAIDLGEKRTGLAIGNDVTRQAGPADVIETSDEPTLIRAIERAIDEYGPDELVLGVPLNMDGSAGPAAQRARAFAARLTAATGLPIHEVDERLTSYAADQMMSRTGLTHKQKKARRDALAAAALLQDFLNRAASDGPSPEDQSH